jgi:hypothetical protein
MKSMKYRKLICVAALILFAVQTAVASTTWYVNGVTGNNNNHCKSPTTACKTISHGISLAHSGDSIVVAAATYYENLTIGKSLKVIGSDASTTIIDGGQSGTVVTISDTTAHVTLSKLTISDGKAPDTNFFGSGFGTRGGGINNSGTLTLTNSTVSGNWAPIPCIRLIRYCDFIFGTALGGGIYNSGALTISNSIISGNNAGGGCKGTCSAFGGGIYNVGTLLMIQNSTLTSNSVGTACGSSTTCQVGVGGAFYTSGGTLTLNNSTVTGNSAYRCLKICSYTSSAIVNGANLAMNNSTVSGNSGGGIVDSGTATLQNSIVSNNSGTNCSGTITSHGYNLSSDDSCKFDGPGDMNHINPMLGALQDNGGPTQTMALLPGSPAIDAGNPSGCTDGQGHLLKTDQRGAPRPDKEDKTGCDMGAYESQND